MSYIFYRDDPGCIDGDCLIRQRYQKSGSCFIHTAIMLQYCLMSRSNKTRNAGAIVDMRVFVRDISSSVELFILNRGGKVPDIFKEIVHGDPKFHLIKIEEIDAELLKTYGPGLLTFNIFNETLVFGNNETLVYQGIPTGKITSCHSVLIIGVRMEGSSRQFLVQNWWSRQQVVVMSEDYVMASLGQAYFIKTQNLVVREGLPWTKKQFGQI